MSTAMKQDRPASLADILREQGSSAAGLEETEAELKPLKALRFAWHPWLAFPNLDGEGFKFNVRYAVLERLEPISITTVPRVVVKGPSPGFSPLGITSFFGTGVTEGKDFVGDSSGMLGMVPGGRGAEITRVQQRPDESIGYLLQAYGDRGMTALTALDADDAEAEMSFVLYEAVMGEARDDADREAGKRAPGLLLEDFPAWLARDAERALEDGFRRGVLRLVKQYRDGVLVGEEPKAYRLPSGQGLERRGMQLIEEIRGGITRAVRMATDPANGVLPKTRKQLQVAKNGGQEGKFHFDGLDVWLMQQFPNFDMDTDSERSARAVQHAVEHGSNVTAETNQMFAKIFEQQQATQAAIAAQMAQTAEQQQAAFNALLSGQQQQQEAFMALIQGQQKQGDALAALLKKK
jgi:hypothetical protein